MDNPGSLSQSRDLKRAESKDESTRGKIGAFLSENLSKVRHKDERGNEKPAHVRVGEEPEAEKQEKAKEVTMKDKFGAFVSDSFNKGRHMAERSLGLGQTPSVIPPGGIDIAGEQRTVHIGWHPVPGLGNWFATTGLGKSITQSTNKFPDPTQHWALIVGDYCHQLWMDENLDVIYTNGKVNRDEWHMFEVGKSRFNDEALKQAGEVTIAQMREKRPAYNLIDNNCQTFAVRLLDVIQIGKHRDFATTYSVYQRALGKGSIKDLFAADHNTDQKLEQLDHEGDQASQQGTVALAQQVMDEKTNKIEG